MEQHGAKICKISKYLAGGLEGWECWRLWRGAHIKVGTLESGMLMKLEYVIAERRAIANTVNCNRWEMKNKKKLLFFGKGGSLLVLILYFTYILPMPQSEYLIPHQCIILSI